MDELRATTNPSLCGPHTNRLICAKFAGLGTGYQLTIRTGISRDVRYAATSGVSTGAAIARLQSEDARESLRGGLDGWHVAAVDHLARHTCGGT